MEITFSTVKDPEVLAYLCKDVHELHHENHPDVFQPYDFDAFYNYFRRMLQKENIYCIIAYDGTAPVGYLLLVHKAGKDNPFLTPDYEEMYVDQMCVIKTYQHQGIGTLLMERLKLSCAEYGIGRIRLNVWSDNVPAVRFYEKAGFEVFQYEMEWLGEGSGGV